MKRTSRPTSGGPVDRLDLRRGQPDDALFGDAGAVDRGLVRPADGVAGGNGKSGVLKSVPTRKAFLTDASHRIRFVSVPKHTSWQNQVEIWFSVRTRRVLKRGDFRSKAELRNRLLEFIASFNRTMAKPYKWTYAGRPLNV